MNNMSIIKPVKRITLLLLILIAPVSFAEESEPLRVLFVGNSYTYYWNLPQAVALMAKSQGREIITKQSTVGGSNLEQHWKGEEGSQTRSLIELGGWDYVVFNNHSLSTIDTPDAFFEYGKKFVDQVRTKGGEAVFYMTWARSHNKLMINTISPAYRRLAEETGAHVVPVGEIWMRSMTLHPEYDLYASDGSHPSTTGTYLTALAFTKFFTGLSVQDVPNSLRMKDSNGEKLYIAHTQSKEGDFFRDLIDMFVFKTAKEGDTPQ